MVIPLLGIINRKAEGVIFSRLDRVLVNHPWIKRYPNATSIHLPIIGSDHAPVILNISPTVLYYKNNFKFEAKWLLDVISFLLVRDVWSDFIKGTHAYQLTRKSKFFNLQLTW